MEMHQARAGKTGQLEERGRSAGPDLMGKDELRELLDCKGDDSDDRK